MLDSVASNTYSTIALGVEPLKSKKPKMTYDSAISSEETPSKKKPPKGKKDAHSKKKPASKPKLTKKKAPFEADRGKGLNVLSKVPNEQQRKTSGANEGTGTKLGVLNVPKYLFESENESWGCSGDDESNDDNSDEVTKDDGEDDVEKEKEEVDLRTPNCFEFNDDVEEYDELYKDVNVRSKVAKHKEKIKGLKQSSSISFDFASKFPNLDNVPPVIDEVASMMNVNSPHEELITKAPPNLSVPVMAILKTSTIYATTVTLIIQPFSSTLQMTTPTLVPTIEPTNSLIPALLDFASLFGFEQRVSATINESLENVVLAKSYSQLQMTYKAAASLTLFYLKKILLDKLEKSKSYRAAKQHRDLYDALRGHEDPPAGPNQGLKKRKRSKDVKPSRGPNLKESKSSSSNSSKSHSKSSSKSAQAEEPVFETTDTKMPQDQGDDIDLLRLGSAKWLNQENLLLSSMPETFRSDITKMTLYTAYNDPQGITYQDMFQRNRLMCSNELYKFCDDTLSSIRRFLLDIAFSLGTNYLPKRRWSKLDRKRSRIMIKAIDQQLFERRLMRNLEKYVRGREYGNNFTLLERTI
uniref:Uncharacterized protein n=1 Tax=Tanacetum cinerariifolium TaxID=118510 RepID=A0A699H860_TANCI|nr:hypothetical protein [Tanacetum cinerariifolium]